MLHFLDRAYHFCSNLKTGPVIQGEKRRRYWLLLLGLTQKSKASATITTPSACNAKNLFNAIEPMMPPNRHLIYSQRNLFRL